MEVNKNNLKVTEKQGVKIEKGLNKGKRLIQKRVFHLGEIIDEVISSYEEDYTSHEYFIGDCKDEWICKKKKWFQTEVPVQTIIKDLIINNKEDTTEGKPEKAKDWTKQLMHEFLQEKNQEA